METANGAAKARVTENDLNRIQEDLNRANHKLSTTTGHEIRAKGALIEAEQAKAAAADDVTRLQSDLTRLTAQYHDERAVTLGIRKADEGAALATGGMVDTKRPLGRVGEGGELFVPRRVGELSAEERAEAERQQRDANKPAPVDNDGERVNDRPLGTVIEDARKGEVAHVRIGDTPRKPATFAFGQEAVGGYVVGDYMRSHNGALTRYSDDGQWLDATFAFEGVPPDYVDPVTAANKSLDDDSADIFN